MANNFRIIYLYIVSLITLCMIVGGIVSTVHYISTYIFPDSYVFFEEDNKDYLTDYNNSYNNNYNNDYSEQKNRLIRQNNYKKEQIKNAVVSIAVITVGSILYKYHWKLIEKERII